MSQKYRYVFKAEPNAGFFLDFDVEPNDKNLIDGFRYFVEAYKLDTRKDFSTLTFYVTKWDQDFNKVDLWKKSGPDLKMIPVTDYQIIIDKK